MDRISGDGVTQSEKRGVSFWFRQVRKFFVGDF